MYKKIIEKVLKEHDLWKNDFKIVANKNIRGQSISYFVYDIDNIPIYIAKYFNYLKDISIPTSINVEECEKVEDLFEKLVDCDDFLEDIDRVSDLIYYNKRSFKRYVEVCNEDDSQFPKVFYSVEDIKINHAFYSLLIEEAINGVTLEEYLKTYVDDRINLALKFLWDMSLIIEKFVEHDIVHRDLSPDNIMLQCDIIRVIDPGVVKIVSRNSTEFGYIMGKRQYVSPEQYYGYALNADFTSDLYSIGIVAFEIVTKINPIKMYIDKRCVKPHEELLNKLDREIEDIFFSEIDENKQSQQLFLVLGKLLQVERKNRFSTIDSFKETLRILREDYNHD